MEREAELIVPFPAELVEAIAQRAAELVAANRADDGYMDVKRAADFLACGPDRIYALVSAGRIPHHRDGSRLLFDRAELRGYVRNGGAKRP
jgi:excisionase family DNA binding protein